jgi:hypothetical protein
VDIPRAASPPSEPYTVTWVSRPRRAVQQRERVGTWTAVQRRRIEKTPPSLTHQFDVRHDGLTGAIGLIRMYDITRRKPFVSKRPGGTDYRPHSPGLTFLAYVEVIQSLSVHANSGMRPNPEKPLPLKNDHVLRAARTEMSAWLTFGSFYSR